MTISNSIIRGSENPAYNRGVVMNKGSLNFVIRDSEIIRQYPSVRLDGLLGWNFTAQRVHIVGGVDSIKISGSNVRVEDSLLENTDHYESDPNQAGGPTHNDNIQIGTGSNLSIVRNTIRGSQTHTILPAAQQGNIQVSILGNWLDGAICNVKLQTRDSWTLDATVRDNKFGPNLIYKKCMISQQKTGNITLAASGNVLENSPYSPVGVFFE